MYNKTCVTSKDLDQLLHPASMARVHVSQEAVDGTMRSGNSDQTAHTCRLILVFSGHCTFCRALDHIWHKGLFLKFHMYD